MFQQLVFHVLTTFALAPSTVVALRWKNASREGPQHAEAWVPFYMYKLPKWTAYCDKYLQYHQNYYPDVALHEVLKDHPWRVTDPSKAKLFIISGYFGLSAAGSCGNHLWNMWEVQKQLTSTPYFLKKMGRDHLISIFWFGFYPIDLGELAGFSQNLIAARFENHSELELEWRRPVPVPYGPVSVRGRDFSVIPWDKRKHSLFFMGQADVRWTYRTRRRALRKLPSHWRDSVLMETLDQHLPQPSGVSWDDTMEDKVPLPRCDDRKHTGCVAEKNYSRYILYGCDSRYSMVIHGDTPSTSRLYDALQFEQFPLIIASEEFQRRGMPFKDDLPWKDMAVFIDLEDFSRRPVDATKEALKQVTKAKRDLWLQTRPYLDWSLQSHCMGTALLSDVGRKYLNIKGLPAAFSRDENCYSPAGAAVVTYAGNARVREELEKEMVPDIHLHGGFH